MDLRHLRTFVSVAELGTVSKAALRLRIAQPALSRQISELERQLGLKLFDRVGRRLRLTGEGEQLLTDCRGLLNYASAVTERAQELRRGDVGVLKVASSPQHVESVLSGFLPRYAERYPNVQVDVVEAAGVDTVLLLERGEVHLGQNLVHAVDPNDRRFGMHLLAPVDILAAFHPSMSLGEAQTIEIERLAPYPLLLLHPTFMIRRAFDSACNLAGLKPKIVIESRAPHTLLSFAEAGHGIAIIPSQLRADRYSLRIMRLTYRRKPLREPLALLWDKRRPLPPYAVSYCEMLAQYCREIFPITRPTEPERHTRRPGARRSA